jgi:hypothetical protein
MLPKCIRERHLAQEAWIFLLDAQIGTAASAFMAIRTLLDHGCRQDHIIFVTFLVAKTGGIHSLRKAFPGITFVCGAVDDDLRELWLPVGNNGIEGSEVSEINHVQNGNKDEESHERKVWVMEPGMGQIGTLITFETYLWSLSDESDDSRGPLLFIGLVYEHVLPKQSNLYMKYDFNVLNLILSVHLTSTVVAPSFPL